MDKWEVCPNVSVGKIKFGMKREEVHNLFKDKCIEFKKNMFSKNTTDDYGRFHVYYTPDNKVDAVEIFEGIELTMEGKVIFPLDACDIDSAIPGIEKDGDSYTHTEKSIGIEVANGKIDCILVGSKGYYE